MYNKKYQGVRGHDDADCGDNMETKEESEYHKKSAEWKGKNIENLNDKFYRCEFIFRGHD